MRNDIYYVYIPNSEITDEHISGSLCTKMSDIFITESGLAILRFKQSPQFLANYTIKTSSEHLEWLAQNQITEF